MRRSRSAELLPLDQEIEATCRRNRRTSRRRGNRTSTITAENQAVQMAENQENQRTLREFAVPVVNDTISGIRRPAIQANNFEIKPAIIQMIQLSVQFGGLASENPNAHLANFLEICDTFKQNGVTEDAIRLRLFPFSLRDKAKEWLNSLPTGSITTWETLAQKFLSKFFPPARTAKLRNEITQFSQFDAETLYEAWERYKELMRRCPHHGIPDWLQVQTFYNGLNGQTRTIVDAAAGGALMAKTPQDALNLLEEMAANGYQWPNERAAPKKVAGMHEVDSIAALTAQVAALSHQIGQMNNSWKNVAAGGSVNEMAAQSSSCNMEDQSYVEQLQLINQPRPPFYNQFRPAANPQNFNPNTYNSSWKNHPNFSWKNNPNTLQPASSSHSPPGFLPIQPENKQPADDAFQQYSKKTDAAIHNLLQITQELRASNRNLELQIGQIANAINSRSQGSLPSSTEVNPKEQCKAIKLRSGKEFSWPKLDDNQSTSKRMIEETQPENEEIQQQKQEAEPVSTTEKQGVRAEEKQQECSKLFPENPPPYVPKIPYPQRLQKKKMDDQFSKFLEVFKKLHINIPFAEALEQMPKYAKFMKEILSKKRRLEDFEMVKLTEECSAILQRKLPQKLKDPGCFTIPCTIGNSFFNKALCDLGASINLMPFSVFKKLGLGEVKPTTVSLQLADRSIKHPRGIIEDVLIKVDKFIFPADFVVLDMEEDEEIPLILGRPFLATGRTLIDVQKGELVLRFQNEQIVFNIFKAMEYPAEFESCRRINVVDREVQEIFNQNSFKDPLERCLVDATDEEDLEIQETREFLKAMGELLAAKSEPENLQLMSFSTAVPSTLQSASIELKPLPSHLKYVFLGEKNSLPVIISADLSQVQEEKLLRILREHRAAIGWTMDDIKGISPSLCMHRILMEDDYKPVVEAQRRLNPIMKEVVRKEVVKWLDAGIIYPISDSSWVSPVQVVPKKGGVTVVKNGDNELIPTRTTTGWRVCIDYRKLNKATRNDHFPLPFIDQMIDRLAGQAFYCFLDGYSGYNQIAITPEDQEKTTFTCPYGTFAFRRMPFGLCNAPATFQRCMMSIFADMIEKFMEVFMDDFSVFGCSFDNCLKNLALVLERCEQTNLILNWEKCHFTVKEGIVLGH